MHSSSSNVGFAVEQTVIETMALPITAHATLGESLHLWALVALLAQQC